MANMIEADIKKKTAVLAAEEVIYRNNEENEIVTPNFERQVVGNISSLSSMAMGREVITKGVVDNYKEVTMKTGGHAEHSRHLSLH